jgi:nucleoside-diphosphate-sugar epimerase
MVEHDGNHLALFVEKIVKDIDVVFDDAALFDVSLSVKNQSFFNDVNVGGTLNLLRRHGI